jgi:predicted DNA binding CopG/RHH family protein
MMSEFENMSQIDDTDRGEPVPVTVRRTVTISVRFSAEEIEAIRQRAEAAGMKVTAYIRQAAVSGGDTIDRDKVPPR